MPPESSINQNQHAASVRPRIVVIGVAGCGKTATGTALSTAWSVPFIEGDEFHPAANRAKMAAAIPLDDSDRWGWLDELAAEIRRRCEQDGGFVLACSALRRPYRDRLRSGWPGLRFLFLDVPQAVALERVAARQGHYMPASLVASQFQTLERPEPGEGDVSTVDATLPLSSIVTLAVERLTPEAGEHG
jgi:gluconokinase